MGALVGDNLPLMDIDCLLYTSPHHAKPDARAPASGLPELAALGIGAIACACLLYTSRCV